MGEALTVNARLRLPAGADAPSRARDVLRRRCVDANVTAEAMETAALLLSEAVTNAVVHAGGEPLVELELDAGLLHVSVTDQDGTGPLLMPGPDLTAEGGRGLRLIAALADEWGVRYGNASKAVWFSLKLEQDQSAVHT